MPIQHACKSWSTEKTRCRAYIQAQGQHWKQLSRQQLVPGTLNLAIRPIAGCCHPANLMTWSRSHCLSILRVSRQTQSFYPNVANNNKRTCLQTNRATNTVKPGTHWRQSRKDVRHSGDRAYRRQSRPSWRQCRPRQAVEFKLLPICRHRATRDVREWLSTYPFPPIAIYLIPIPSHAHSQVFDLFPFPWDSRVGYSHSLPFPFC